MKRGLIVFAREPLPGTVKTRLAATVGDRAAAELYGEMLRDVLSTARQLSGVETVVFWDCPEESLQELAEKYRCASCRQSQGDLGQRMRSAFEEMFAGGMESCCIIGSDAPDLPASHVLEAYQHLEEQHADVVFGPTLDGGYYLLGMKQLQPGLFSGISWSSAEVLEQSLAVSRAAGLSAVLLPEWQDIDTFDDLQSYLQRKRSAGKVETI